ncbi:Alpha/Beta hydrolase protein [Xylogone sp. PMI_703]|nr:Alpha/Beta hydrolase protein [Xylogone sp. PMI_703]
MSLPMFFLVSALLSSLPLARTAAPGMIRWIDCAKSVPGPTTSSTLNISAIDLTNLPTTLHCGQLDVPMDYSKPFCETNMITLGLAMYRPANPKGVLFFNPGGTDAGVVVAWEVALNATQAFDGLLDFDLLMLDVRGTFSSNQLNVSLDTLTPLFGPYPTTESEFDSIKNVSATAIQSWIVNSSPPGIIQHVGTKEVVHDYEQVRKALGYEKVNFLGASYGSFRAMQYAATFPERVDRFVLDSVTPHGRSFFQQAQDDVAATNRLMQRVDAYCLNNASCPFHGKGKGSVLEAYKQVLDIARKTPFFIPECVNTTICYPYATALDVQTIMLGNLLGAPDFPAILEGVDNALNGDGSFFMNGPGSLESVVAMPLLCNDYDYERNFETFQTSLEQGLKSDITGIGQTQGWLIQLMCSAWPFPVPPSEPLIVNKSMLLVTADFDGSAPTEWTTFTWEQAPNSTLVVRHGDDHVSFLLVDQASTKITKEFLNTGIIPAAQENEFVSVYTPGMTRKPISDPYLIPVGALAGDVDSGNVTVEIPF